MFKQENGYYDIAVVLPVLSGLFIVLSYKHQSEWIDLIGDDQSGWIQRNGTATYEFVDGMIIGRTPIEESPSSSLCTDEEYGDFELEFENRVDTGFNSGVQIRSKLMTEADATAMIESMSQRLVNMGRGRGDQPDTTEGQGPGPEAREGIPTEQEADTSQRSQAGTGPFEVAWRNMRIEPLD